MKAASDCVLRQHRAKWDATQTPTELRIRWALSDTAMYGTIVGFAPGRLHFDVPRNALLANFSMWVPAKKEGSTRERSISHGPCLTKGMYARCALDDQLFGHGLYATQYFGEGHDTLSAYDSVLESVYQYAWLKQVCQGVQDNAARIQALAAVLVSAPPIDKHLTPVKRATAERQYRLHQFAPTWRQLRADIGDCGLMRMQTMIEMELGILAYCATGNYLAYCGRIDDDVVAHLSRYVFTGDEISHTHTYRALLRGDWWPALQGIGAPQFLSSIVAASLLRGVCYEDE